MVEASQNARKKVAILIEDGFEDSEFKVPYTALRQAGAKVSVLGSRMNQEYRGKQGKVSIKPDGTTTEARAQDFDAVIIPGGLAPDTMRNNPNTVNFVKEAIAEDKIVAAVCHGPQVLIEADLLRDRRVTGFTSIRKDMENAGATYIDEPLAIDGTLITSRQPGDLAIFTTAILSRLMLQIPDRTLPEESDTQVEWWELAASWGGSSRSEIVEGLNTALAGERYTHEAFQHYAERTSDTALRLLLLEIVEKKATHIELLEGRLQAIGEQLFFPSVAAGALANAMSWLQSSEDIEILRRALGDIQTGVVDCYHLRTKYTDPVSTMIFTTLEQDLAESEQRLASLYQASLGMGEPQPAAPSTSVAVG